ncbi:MAG TPA: fumarate hydratase [Candidatus Limiplasma sp.]|nr:fumarate hydratase [Candidatus Limiplasma sp.]HPS82515.1 fumarate hydratase [Candidatus Limiplasma sp.]
MRTIQSEQIADCIARLCRRACTVLPNPVATLIAEAAAREPYPPACDVLHLLQKNAAIAAEEDVPICQDTGMAVVFAQLGQDVHVEGDTLENAVNAGVARGYTDGWLRKSVVRDPIRRGNTGDNTPAVLHIRAVPGDKLTLTVSPKGFGSENMSRLAMLTPADGLEGVKAFVLETVRLAGANPCPPMMLGIGIGSTFEGVALLAKEALVELREGPHPDPFYQALEEEWLAEINRMGIGPQGFGGLTTALSVRIKTAPTHIAGLPVAVNVGCHVTRHATETL